MAITGNAALVATKQDLISALVQKELTSKGILAGTVQDVSRFAVKGAKTIAFPKAGSFTVEDRASGVAATTQNLTFAVDTLALDKTATVSWLIDDQDALESVIDVDAEYAMRAAAAHAVYLDQQIKAQLEAAGDATATVAVNITDAVILEMRSALLRRKADPRLLRLAISPEQEAAMLAINKFTLVEQYGSAVVQSGAFGFIYGMPVFVTPEIDADEYYLYEQGAVAVGFQRGPTMGERLAPEYGATSMLKTLDQKFGVKALQINQQGVGVSESALIMKDGNV
jgi:hypothetical protein